MRLTAVVMRVALSRLLGATLALLLGGAAFGQVREFDVPAGPLRQTLPMFARQAGVQIVAPGGESTEHVAQAVQGSLELHVALQVLLQGSGLAVVADDGGTLTLARSSGAEHAPSGSLPANTPNPAASARPAVGDMARAGPPAGTRSLEGITVVGSHLQRAEADSLLPLTLLTRREIDASGAATAAELFSQLPQAAEFDTSETATGPNDARGDAVSLNLRGIGSGSTLVLLNGRRIAPHPISAGEVPRLSANINQIPLSAVQSIEVLRDGASAVHGSDAVAGVVNTTLRRDFEGVAVRLRQGDAVSGSLPESSFSVVGGGRSAAGSTRWMAFVTGLDRGSLAGEERSLSSDLRARAGSSEPGWNNSSLSSPYGAFVAGALQPDGSFLATPVPGTDANGGFHVRPVADAVEAAAGPLPPTLRYDLAPHYLLVPRSRRAQVFATLDHDLGADTRLLLDAFYYRADSRIANATAPISANADNGIHVPAQNFYNPFGTRFFGPGTEHPELAPRDVLIRNYRPVELGSRSAEVGSRSFQITAGARGRVGDWSWESAALHGVGRTLDRGRNMMSERRLRSQLALSSPDAFNVFGGPGANGPDVLDAVRIETWRRGESRLSLIDARVNGHVELPWSREVQAALGIEMREEGFSEQRDPYSLGDDVIAQSISANADGKRRVRSAFAEFAMPLIEGIDGPRLDLSFASRVERYSDFGSTAAPKLGLLWSPLSRLRVRASYNRGFRAPTLAQVYVGDTVRRTGGEPDPYRVDVTGSAADRGVESRRVVRGGNPELGPERSRSLNLGVVLEPIDQLTLSIDRFVLRQHEVIDTIGEAEQLALDFALRSSGSGFNPDVVRFAPSAADQAAFAAFNAAHPDATRSPAGEIDFIRDRYVNLAARRVSGTDLSLRWRLRPMRLGALLLRADVAHLDRFEQRRASDLPAQSSLALNGLPRTRALAAVHWSLDPWQAALQAHYIGRFRDSSAPRNAAGELYRVSSWTGVNGYTSLRLDHAGGAETELRVGINNLFDRAPPLADEDRGFDQLVHDARGRFLYVELHSRW
jgi:iron complex outermembrane receptor protein